MKSRREHRHSSIIYLHGNPVGIGYNDTEHHAEENAIHAAGGGNIYYGNDFSKHTIVNVRVTPGGKIGIAKPCLACLELLKKKRFRKVIYSTNKGTFEEIWL